MEITPIRAKSIPAEELQVSPIVNMEIKQEVETLIPAISDGNPEPIPTDTPVTVEDKAETVKTVSTSKPENKKTAAWVWIVLVLGLALVGFIIWQIQSQSTPSTNVQQAENSKVSPEEERTSTASTEPESTPTEQNQITENHDSIVNQSISNPNISKPAETGTTIANIASGNLIRIESKAERPQYFIIVGSLPNEKLAIEEANQYFGKSPEIYLISPEEGSRNYRLALSKFGSFRLAADELERIKSQYTEELWILKY
ncbi:hypothetical protein [Algoriphagus boritolerans]|uniref:SPOR domain-containing protein n=1 Tax=Algoriphagus boritolerans TaxID=308111 RepID=UPI000AE4B77B